MTTHVLREHVGAVAYCGAKVSGDAGNIEPHVLPTAENLKRSRRGELADGAAVCTACAAAVAATPIARSSKRESLTLPGVSTAKGPRLAPWPIRPAAGSSSTSEGTQ